ncbi:hypothetical protein NNC19_14575 [Clostridium sp. SHJSY1]|uniref:hypothetical protein n=1 Tax=Clostridium sp. SHJSY1 TaxID=2942483 RepID=UPI002874A829|nr:hypothetical protein [Clostridium sp. SHJSY1]MDS0526914.1 hypothetical protein [Clostridium sp. SHJSY1]
MKGKKLILGLAITLTMGLGITAYASNDSNNATQSNSTTVSSHQKAGLKRATGMRGYDFTESILKNKLGMTDEEISNGLNSEKTVYDLAKDKGMSESDFKAAVLEEKNKAIDKAATDGTITKEEGDSIKETLKNNAENCIGVPGEMRNQNGNGKERHMSGGMRGTGNCTNE